MTSREAVRRSVPASELPDFTPVPRKRPRHDGWTPERQRAFIEALADTGCVAIAARMVNMSQPSVYQLRRQPGAESFRAAMEAAQTLGLQVVKDEAFHRAMEGELIPVFVGGKLMGHRRKKNDRLLMFILRHYGQDATGRRTTINYFSTRATAGTAQTPLPSGECRVGPAPGRPQIVRGTIGPTLEGPAAKRWEGEGRAIAAAEASTTTVKTIISGPGNAPSQLDADESAANAINAFAGVDLDAEAQDQIYRALTACAERRRLAEDDPENDPERFFIGADEAGDYLGTLESGVEGDWVECEPEGWQRPEGEHRWENLGEGGQAEEIDKVLAGMAERKAATTEEEIAADRAAHAAEVQRIREKRALPPPVEPGPDDPRLDWRNWETGLYAEPKAPPLNPPRTGGEAHRTSGGHPGTTGRSLGDRPEPFAQAGGGAAASAVEIPAAKARRTYKKRQPKPAFTAPDEGRKAEAIAEVEVERRELAAAEAERRKDKTNRI